MRMKFGTWICTNVYNMHTVLFYPYLKGQGHSMTLQQNCLTHVIWSRILQLFQRNEHHIGMPILVATLKVNVTAWPSGKNVSGP